MSTECPSLEALPPQGSRRPRIWELPPACHCPVVGTCISPEVLRRLLAGVLGACTDGSDYQIHVLATSQCRHRSAVTKTLQRELDRRHAAAIRRLQPAKDVGELAREWSAALAQNEVPGSFWATLTHPRCDEALRERLCQDLHMLQHRASARAVACQARAQDLLHENGVLGRELGRAQERVGKVLAAKNECIDALRAQLREALAAAAHGDHALRALRDEIRALRASIPELAERERLLRRIEYMGRRQAALQAQLVELRQHPHAARADAAVTPASAPHALPPRETPPAPCACASVGAADLPGRTVLCVGGRSGSVASYREIVESTGARFAHHDGGLENGSAQLDASLAAADLVICQTGCIGHNAYWRVKDSCKRTGKRCIFVSNPSAASLARCLGRDEASATGPATVELGAAG